MSMYRTLILNTSYGPHDICEWKDAVTLMFKGAIEVIAQYDEVLAHIDGHTLQTFPELRKALRQVIPTDVERIDFKVPAVCVLRRRVSSTKTGIKFSKMNVCLRDRFTCQYCGTKLPMSALNYDHVIPRRSGGKTVWENIVASCYRCNEQKGGRTPEEAGMKILSVPRKPANLPMAGPFIDVETAPEEWRPYLRTA